MGGRSGGGVVSGSIERDTTYKGQIKNVESLIHMKDPAMYKVTKEAISNFAAKLGIPERNVKLADLTGDVMAIGSKGNVFLNKKYFNLTKQQFSATMAENYNVGHLTKTNKPLAHVVTHELAHASWTSDLKVPKFVAAEGDIKSLYKSWSKSSRKGYGTYAASNIDEFWAEVSTKAAHGEADKWTKKAKAIYKEYNL